MTRYLSTRQVAQQVTDSSLVIGEVEEWQVRRVFELGILAEPPKFGGKRMIEPLLVPQIVEAMRLRGWLPKAEALVTA